MRYWSGCEAVKKDRLSKKLGTNRGTMVINGKVFLTSNGLNEETQQILFDKIGRKPSETKIIFVPTAGISMLLAI